MGIRSGVPRPYPSDTPVIGDVLTVLDDSPLRTEWGTASLLSPSVPVDSGGNRFWQVLPGRMPFARDIPFAMVADTGYYIPFQIDAEWSPTQFAIDVSVVSAAGGLIYAWIYQADGEQQPTAAFLDITAAGGLVGDALGNKSVATAQAFQAGRYVAVLRATLAVTLRAFSTADATGSAIGTTFLTTRTRAAVVANTIPAPADWTAGNLGANSAPCPLYWK
jgi:hypothetical protein